MTQTYLLLLSYCELDNSVGDQVAKKTNFPIDITNFSEKNGLVVAPYNQILPLIRKHMRKKIGFEKY